MKTSIFAVSAMLVLSGCTTLQFAPPNVNLTFEGSDGSVNSRCELPSADTKLSEDVSGGLKLVDNFVHVYRCAARGAANGRQGFEVPALLTAAGAGVAAALGAGPDVAIAAGGSIALLSSSKSYYAPRDKAAIYQRGLDAVNCINNESVGVPSFDPLVAEAKSGNPRAGQGGGGTVSVKAEQQYFRLIRGSLLSVETVMFKRLSETGTFDPAGLVAEIEAIQAKIEEAEKERETEEDSQTGADPSPASDVGDQGTNADDNTPSTDDTGETSSTPNPIDQSSPTMDSRQNSRMTQRGSKGITAEEIISLDLQVLKPKLDQCVVRAKL